MKRRVFLNSTLAGPAMAALSMDAGSPRDDGGQRDEAMAMPDSDGLNMSDLPIFCAHEHWGSLSAIGMAAEGFRCDTEPGAEPQRPVSILDLVLDPYFGGWLAAAGYDVAAEAQRAGFDSLAAWWQEAPEAVLASLGPPMRNQCATGAFQCIRHGLRTLHGADIAAFAVSDWLRTDAAVRSAYADMFGWHRKAMSTLGISGLIRPVHPEFFFRKGARADVEAAFTSPILRIDPFLELWPEVCPRRDALADLTGVYPGDASSWRAFITAIFERAAAGGNTGIKQLQAYSRSLAFEARSDGEVVFSGPLDDAQRAAFQDWIVHECCKQAHERRWPHQVHVGTHNLSQSSPLPLEALARRYPDMNLVLLHCWPFVEESAWLAKHLANVFLDGCWQMILNPVFFRRSMEVWLGYVPASKLMCSQDATSVEMAAGSILLTRRYLGAVLSGLGAAYRQPESHLRAIAADMLHNNAVHVYGVGERVEA